MLIDNQSTDTVQEERQLSMMAPAFKKVTIGNATLYCGDSLALLRAGRV